MICVFSESVPECFGYFYFFLVQRDLSGAGDLTLASEYGGNYFFT